MIISQMRRMCTICLSIEWTLEVLGQPNEAGGAVEDAMSWPAKCSNAVNTGSSKSICEHVNAMMLFEHKKLYTKLQLWCIGNTFVTFYIQY
jgi:hypothetical protein